MKKFIIILLAFVSFSINAQQIDYNLKKGAIAEGYDVTEYFNDRAVEGSKKISTTHDGATFYFANQANLDKFKANPEKFIPQYGGYCAYAIADDGKKVQIDPESFEIRDGKLYLFYDAFWSHTLKKWKEEGPEKLKGQADAAWAKVQYEKS